MASDYGKGGKNEPIQANGVVDIGLPTPVEVAYDLENSFTPDQAADIAQHVYQPLREAIRGLMLKGIF